MNLEAENITVERMDGAVFGYMQDRVSGRIVPVSAPAVRVSLTDKNDNSLSYTMTRDQFFEYFTFARGILVDG